MLIIPADIKNSKKDQTYENTIFTKCKECQNIQAFAFLQHLQAYSGILQIFLSAFPAQFLEFSRVCPCVYYTFPNSKVEKEYRIIYDS